MAPLLEEICAEVLRTVTPTSEERKLILELAKGVEQRVSLVFLNNHIFTQSAPFL